MENVFILQFILQILHSETDNVSNSHVQYIVFILVCQKIDEIISQLLIKFFIERIFT